VVGSDFVGDEGAGSARQYSDDDVAKLVRLCQTKSGETHRVDGAFHLRSVGWGRRKMKGGWQRSGSGGASKELTSAAVGATAGSGRTLGAHERNARGRVRRARASCRGAAERLDEACYMAGPVKVLCLVLVISDNV
jgi:hypothetical protein